MAIRQRDKIDINDLIRDTVLLLQPVFKQRQRAVARCSPIALPAIYGDGNSIQRVLINLLDNAVMPVMSAAALNRHPQTQGR